jgi:N6-adenosine-specific RNA methylase IME4
MRDNDTLVIRFPSPEGGQEVPDRQKARSSERAVEGDDRLSSTSSRLLLEACERQRFGTVLADPPWRFSNRTGKMAPEHRRLSRYGTMSLEEIKSLPVGETSLPQSHLYLWVPNALIHQGLEVMSDWGFTYKTNLVWYKVRKDGGPDGRGVGFYFRNVTELVLFGVKGSLRTRSAGRRQVNLLSSRKREHSRKPSQLYDIIERCSPGPYLELFARHTRPGWTQWGDEIGEYPEQLGIERSLEEAASYS